jgi:uncharacterized membrane protein
MMTDQRIERMVSTLLRIGVLISGGTVLIGGLLYLLRHGEELANYSVFRGETDVNRVPGKIVAGVSGGRPQAIIQFGILLLIATPVARVVLCLVGFALERDRDYVIATAIVLAILLFSLLHGVVAG